MESISGADELDERKAHNSSASCTEVKRWKVVLTAMMVSFDELVACAIYLIGEGRVIVVGFGPLEA